MTVAAKGALGCDEPCIIFDKGYLTGLENLAGQEGGITTAMPRPAMSGGAAKGIYFQADFTYGAGHDVYIFPAGEELTYSSTRNERGV